VCQNVVACALIPNRMSNFVDKCYAGTAGDAKHVEPCPILRFTTKSLGAIAATIWSQT